MVAEKRWFVYAGLPGVIREPDLTPSALIGVHRTFEEADDAATVHRLGPEGEVLVYDVHDFRIVATHTEAQLLIMAGQRGG